MTNVELVEKRNDVRKVRFSSVASSGRLKVREWSRGSSAVKTASRLIRGPGSLEVTSDHTAEMRTDASKRRNSHARSS